MSLKMVLYLQKEKKKNFVLTKLTFVVSLAAMIPHVEYQFIVPIERFSTRLTAVWFLPSMGPIVSL